MLANGPILSYFLDRHNFFKVWENSPAPISWADIVYPPVCAFISLIGVVLAIAGLIGRKSVRASMPYAYAVAVPVTLVYTFFVFGMQSITSGADRLGECPGLDGAAVSSNAIPESHARPGDLDIGCGVERRGLFLLDYNDITVAGVTDPTAQQKILDKITEYYRQEHTHPVQVIFRETGTWTVGQGKNGVTFGTGHPGKLIRIANVG